MKNSLIVLLAVVCLVLGAIGGVSYTGSKQAKREVEALRAAAEEETLIGAARPKATEEEKRLHERVKKLEAELAAVKSGEGGAAVKAEDEKKEKKGAAAMMKNLAKMMEDPAMQDMMRSQQRIALDGMFGDFFRQFEVSEEEEAAIRELLLDRQMMATTLGMKAIDGDKTPAERAEIGKQIGEEMDAINKKIEETLGEERYKDFKLFEDSQQERQLLTSYKDVLAREGIALDQEVEEQLMTAMYDTRKGFNFSTNFGNQTNPDMYKNFSKTNADRYLEEYKRLQAQVYEKASSILTPEQLEVFRESQEGDAKMQEMAMKMSFGFLGGEGE